MDRGAWQGYSPWGCKESDTTEQLTSKEKGFPDGSAGKESSCNAGDTGDMGLIPVLGRSPEGGKWQPTPVFLPEKSHGQEEPGGL